MSKDSAMLARRTMRTQIITSLVAVSSYPSLCVCVRICMCSFSVYILLYSMCVYACICRFWRKISAFSYGYYRQRNFTICQLKFNFWLTICNSLIFIFFIDLIHLNKFINLFVSFFINFSCFLSANGFYWNMKLSYSLRNFFKIISKSMIFFMLFQIIF